jgi:hypothetical protein
MQFPVQIWMRINAQTFSQAEQVGYSPRPCIKIPNYSFD